MSLSKLKLSGSTDGKGIKVTGTSSGGSVTLHTADATALDEIWLYAVNTDTTARLLTIEFGGTSSPDNTITKTISPQGSEGRDGLILVVPGYLLTNSLVAKAFAATANVIMIYGYVHRIA